MGKKGDKATAAGADFFEKTLPRLEPLKKVTSRKMFGGYGIFHDGKMFALITSKAELFFKIDESNQARYRKARAPQHGKMPYCRVPKSVLADDANLLEWARESVKIAKR